MLLSSPKVEILPPVMFPVTPKVEPTVAELLTVNALTVLFPLTLSLVKIAVLGVTLPIGVACMPPKALNVVIAVIDPLLVIAAAVTLPVVLTIPVTVNPFESKVALVVPPVG